jgi:ketosteroid isomerase-like protein
LTTAGPLKIIGPIDMSADADELGGTMTATTPDAAATVRLLLEAFLTGDVETVMSYVDDDIEWNPAEHHPFLTQPIRGRQQYMNGLATVADVLDGFRLDIQRVHACGDVAVSEVYYHATVNNTGRSFDVQAAILWDVRDGKVVFIREYMDTWAANSAYQPAGE